MHQVSMKRFITPIMGFSGRIGLGFLFTVIRGWARVRVLGFCGFNYPPDAKDETHSIFMGLPRCGAKSGKGGYGA